MSKFYRLGKRAEARATQYLISKGYRILARNYRYQKAEVDIIARKEAILAIVEVKARSQMFFDDLSWSVSDKKKKLLILAADHYVQDKDLEVEVRFDVITLIGKSGGFLVKHIEDAFYHF